MFIYIKGRIYHYIDGLMQDCSNPIANAWSYCSLALSPRYIPAYNVIVMDRIAFNLYKIAGYAFSDFAVNTMAVIHLAIQLLNRKSDRHTNHPSRVSLAVYKHKPIVGHRCCPTMNIYQHIIYTLLCFHPAITWTIFAYLHNIIRGSAMWLTL